MKRLLALAVIAATAIAVGLASDRSSAATHECRGFRVCVPVAGPWVAVPGTLGSARSSSSSPTSAARSTGAGRCSSSPAGTT